MATEPQPNGLKLTRLMCQESVKIGNKETTSFSNKDYEITLTTLGLIRIKEKMSTGAKALTHVNNMRWATDE